MAVQDFSGPFFAVDLRCRRNLKHNLFVLLFHYFGVIFLFLLQILQSNRCFDFDFFNERAKVFHEHFLDFYACWLLSSSAAISCGALPTPLRQAGGFSVAIVLGQGKLGLRFSRSCAELLQLLEEAPRQRVLCKQWHSFCMFLAAEI